MHLIFLRFPWTLMCVWHRFQDFEEDVAQDKGDDVAQFDGIKARLPKRVKKKRTNASGGVEEYHDYLFPDEVRCSACRA